MVKFTAMKKSALIQLSVVMLVSMWSVRAYGQAENHLSGSPVKWMTFEEAVEKSKTEKRKIFIDVFTDWCGWCKVMDKNTFPDTEVAKVLNEKFYPVKFNAEQTEDVVFRGTTFKYVSQGQSGYHQLAAALLNGQLSYPNFVFLDEEFRIISVDQSSSSLPGYKKPEDFYPFLSFVGTESYQKMKLAEYLKGYKSPYLATDAAHKSN